MLLPGNNENILRLFLRVDKCYRPLDYTLHVSLVPYSVDLSLTYICIHLLLNLVRFLELFWLILHWEIWCYSFFYYYAAVFGKWWTIHFRYPFMDLCVWWKIARQSDPINLFDMKDFEVKQTYFLAVFSLKNLMWTMVFYFYAGVFGKWWTIHFRYPFMDLCIWWKIARQSDPIHFTLRILIGLSLERWSGLLRHPYEIWTMVVNWLHWLKFCRRNWELSIWSSL